MTVRAAAVLFFLVALCAAVNSLSAPTPQFPLQMAYFATMVMKQSNVTYRGVHYINGAHRLVDLLLCFPPKWLKFVFPSLSCSVRFSQLTRASNMAA